MCPLFIVYACILFFIEEEAINYARSINRIVITTLTKEIECKEKVQAKCQQLKKTNGIYEKNLLLQ